MNLLAPSQSDPRARPEPFAFYPPKNSPLVISLAECFIRPAIRQKLRVTEIEIADEDLDRLRRLKGQRCLLSPSHSGGFEPHILMYLGKLLGDHYNYVATVELFEQSPVYRWLMPRLGAYSITRGAMDRSSFSMTRQLLAEGKRWLVIFPEGHTIWQNSLVIPFQDGVFQLAFKGYRDAAKADPEAHLYCIPMAIKYVYLQDMHAEIDASLERLENKLSLAMPSPPLSRYARLRRVAKTVLTAIEKAQRFTAPTGSDLHERVELLKLHAVKRLEGHLGVVPSKHQTLLDRIHALFRAADLLIHEEPSGSEYERQLALERQQAVQDHYEDLWRLQQFVAIQDGYVRTSMTFERFLDILCLLEKEVCRERKVWGPRKAVVRVGEPLDLKDHATAYAADRRGAVHAVTTTIESSVRTMLEEMEQGCQFVDDTVAVTDSR